MNDDKILPVPEIMNVKEVAAYLRVHPSTIYRLLKDKTFPAFRVGSDWRFNLSAIDQWRLSRTSQTLRRK